MSKPKIAALLIAAVLLTAAVTVILTRRSAEEGTESASAEAAVYFCPMHPSVTSDEPGNCPICGMRLVRRNGSGSSGVAGQLADSAELFSGIALSAEQQVLANLRTVEVVPTTATSELVASGRVTFDERRLAQVSSYTAGRIEQLFVNFTGDLVTRGQAVATVYSPELYAAQREYLVALANLQRMQGSGFPAARAAAEELADSGRRRLFLLGMTSSQVESFTANRRIEATTAIVSPVSGIVIRKLVVPQQSVMAGEALLEIADLSTIWVEADVYEQDLSRIAVGQPAIVVSPALPDQEIPGTVTFISPVISGESRTTAVRIEIPNRALQLKPDMYVTVRLLGASSGPALFVPPGAIVDRGSRQFVWVAVSPGTFQPREVTTGARTAAGVEILSGLTAGERIAAEGAFLIDSEAQLRSATAGGADGSHNH